MEGDLRGGAVRWRAAAGIRALSAVAQLVGTRAVAALVDQADGARGCVAGLTVTPLAQLGKQNRRGDDPHENSEQASKASSVSAKVLSRPGLPGAGEFSGMR